MVEGTLSQMHRRECMEVGPIHMQWVASLRRLCRVDKTTIETVTGLDSAIRICCICLVCIQENKTENLSITGLRTIETQCSYS